jgi:protein-tyrosine phosphatase
MLDAKVSPRRSPLRIPEIEGALNLRDIGGYRGDGGLLVRRGRVYRSGTLSRLTPTGIAQVERLGVQTVFDLRATREREREPCALTQLDNLTYWSRDHDIAGGDLPRMLRDPTTSTADMRRRMIETYRTLPFDYAESFAALFGHIAKDTLPLIFNCSAGKDRTGIAAALLLDMLGVSRRTIMRDYAQTERLLEADRRTATGDRAKLYEFAQHTAPGVITALLRSDPAYLAAAFIEIEARHGSVATYLADIGVTNDIRTAVRHQLLTQPDTQCVATR